MTPPPHHRAIAKHIVQAWGSKPRVVVMTAVGTQTKQAIFLFDGYPEPTTVAYSTVGLSDHGGFELAMVGSVRNKSLIKVVFDVASFIVDGFRSVGPGATFEKVINRYYSCSNAGHLLLSGAPISGLAVPAFSAAGLAARWLYGCAITSDEFLFATSEGHDALDMRLAALSTAEIADLGRYTLPGIAPFHPWPAA